MAAKDSGELLGAALDSRVGHALESQLNILHAWDNGTFPCMKLFLYR